MGAPSEVRGQLAARFEVALLGSVTPPNDPRNQPNHRVNFLLWAYFLIDMWCSPVVSLGLRGSAGYDPLPLCGEGFDMVGIVLVVIITAWVFDFTNGFHDTANAMATSIATGALKPRVAVAVSGVRG
jgi:hypothetical protein